MPNNGPFPTSYAELIQRWGHLEEPLYNLERLKRMPWPELIHHVSIVKGPVILPDLPDYVYREPLYVADTFATEYMGQFSTVAEGQWETVPLPNSTRSFGADMAEVGADMSAMMVLQAATNETAREHDWGQPRGFSQFTIDPEPWYEDFEYHDFMRGQSASSLAPIILDPAPLSVWERLRANYSLYEI